MQPQNNSRPRSRVWRLQTAGIAFILLAVPATASTLSTFTSNDEGWASRGFANISNEPAFGSVLTNSGVTFNASGGNPGGYISKQDPDGNWQYFNAPAAFLGNQSSAIGGSLSFDELIINTFGQPALNPQGPLVALTNGSLTLVYGGGGSTPPVSGSAWNSLTVPFAAGSWKVGTPAGAVATTAQFSSVVSGLTGLYILSDFWTGSGGNGEILGLDNVKLQSNAPEPGTAAACLAGLGLLVAALRRTRKI